MARYYMAYGSNLNIGQMKYRCPGAEVVTTATLKNWKLVFRGSKTGSYLTIEKAKGYSVPIALWRITKDDELSLDFYEGYPSFYYKRRFILPCDDGRKHRAFAYIMHEHRPIGVPSARYMDVCAEGYDAFGFDLNILKTAEEEAYATISAYDLPKMWA